MQGWVLCGCSRPRDWTVAFGGMMPLISVPYTLNFPSTEYPPHSHDYHTTHSAQQDGNSEHNVGLGFSRRITQGRHHDARRILRSQCCWFPLVSSTMEHQEPRFELLLPGLLYDPRLCHAYLSLARRGLEALLSNRRGNQVITPFLVLRVANRTGLTSDVIAGDLSTICFKSQDEGNGTFESHKCCSGRARLRSWRLGY